MKKAKSRNFILIICGVFIFLILGFAMANFLVDLFNNIDDDKQKEAINDILVSSSKIKLTGNGNFVDGTPKVNGTEILDFNVILKTKSDKVSYSLKICNNNLEDIVYVSSNYDNLKCSDESGKLVGCENILVSGYVRRGNKIIEGNELIPANSCSDFVIDVEYIGYDMRITQVFIDRYIFNIK